MVLNCFTITDVPTNVTHVRLTKETNTQDIEIFYIFMVILKVI